MQQVKELSMKQKQSGIIGPKRLLEQSLGYWCGIIPRASKSLGPVVKVYLIFEALNKPYWCGIIGMGQ